MVMKGIYIHNGSKTIFGGVNQKIINQIEIFSNYFEMHEIIIEKEQRNPIWSFLWRLPGFSWGAEYKDAIKKISFALNDSNEKTFFYIRKGLIDRRYIIFLKNLKATFPNALIILEVPTYPYGMELLQNKYMWPWFFKDIFHSRKISRYLDKVVTYSKDQQIFNVDTIRIANGIIVGSRPYARNEEACLNLQTINILAVAQFQKSHGYERIIEGMARYYSTPRLQNVVLHMVGDGEEREFYQRLSNKRNLQDKIIFYGMKQGDELENLYKKADLGLGCFGLYKRNIETISSLKTAEYLSHGLPIVTGVKENLLEGLSTDYYCEFPNDKSEINIEQVVNFYSKLRSTHSLEDLRLYLYKFAKDTIDMSVTMKPVIDYIIAKEKDENNSN